MQKKKRIFSGQPAHCGLQACRLAGNQHLYASVRAAFAVHGKNHVTASARQRGRLLQKSNRPCIWCHGIQLETLYEAWQGSFCSDRLAGHLQKSSVFCYGKKSCQCRLHLRWRHFCSKSTGLSRTRCRWCVKPASLVQEALWPAPHIHRLWRRHQRPRRLLLDKLKPTALRWQSRPAANARRAPV